MTERAMADTRVLRLVMLLYDICHDIFLQFFKFKCLQDDDFNDESLSYYVKIHKNQFKQHLETMECHNCSENDSDQLCIKIPVEQFKNFFNTDCNVNDDQIHELQTSQIYERYLTTKCLSISMIQYLLLADNLEPVQHGWIITLHNQRQRLSELSLRTMPKDLFEKMWLRCEKTMLEMVRFSCDSPTERALEKAMKYAKSSDSEWRMVKEFWDQMQTEFQIKEPYLPDVSHEIISEETEQTEVENPAFYLHAENIIIGDNADLHSGINEQQWSELKELLQTQRKGMEERIVKRLDETTLLLANIMTKQYDSSSPEKDDLDKAKGVRENSKGRSENANIDDVSLPEEEKLNIATGGLDSSGDKTENSGKDKDRQRIQIIMKDMEITDVSLKTMQSIKSITLSNGESIYIDSVSKGSVVIEATFPVWIVADRVLFMKAISEFLQEITNKCGIDTSTTLVMEVDVITGLSAMETLKRKSELENQKSEKNICEQCILKNNQLTALRQKLQVKERKYGKMLPMSYVGTTNIKETREKGSIDELTGYDVIDENDIYIAEFPNVTVKAVSDYLHIANNQIVASMKKGANYNLIKQVGDWLEILEVSGRSFFVLAEYCESGSSDHTGQQTSEIIGIEDSLDVDEKAGLPEKLKQDTMYHTISEMEEYVTLKDEEQDENTEKIPLLPPKRSTSYVKEKAKLFEKEMVTTKRPASYPIDKEESRRDRDEVSSEISGVKVKSGFSFKLPSLKSKRFKTGRVGRKDKDSANYEVDPSGRKLDAKGFVISLFNFKEIKEKILKLLKSRPKREELILQGKIQATIFGSSLKELCENEMPVALIPSFVRKCIAAIEKRGLDSQKLYKVQDQTNDLLTLRYNVEQGRYNLDSSEWTVYTLTNILLHLFYEMKEPLLPMSLSKTMTGSSEERKEKLKLELDKLPKYNYETFKFLCKHFIRVLHYKNVNGMDVQSIAEAVGPSFMYTRPSSAHSEENVEIVAHPPDVSGEIVSLCLVEYDSIFSSTC